MLPCRRRNQKETGQSRYRNDSPEKYGEKSKLIEAIADVDGVIVRSDILDAEVLNAAKKLKIAVRAGAGYDNIDLATATANGVCVMNTPGQNSNAVAELVFGMTVMLVRNFYNGTSGTELKGKKLGIHAFGQVGRNVARIGQRFGMEVYAFDPYCPAEAIEAEGVKPITDINEMYSTCQYISLHIPATPETKKSINYNLLKQMPKGAVLINTARKEILNEEELVKLWKTVLTSNTYPILSRTTHLYLPKNLKAAISSLRKRWELKQPKPTSTPVSQQPSNQ